MDHLLVDGVGTRGKKKRERERERIDRKITEKKKANSANSNAFPTSRFGIQLIGSVTPTWRGSEFDRWKRRFDEGILDVVKIVTFSAGRKKNFLRPRRGTLATIIPVDIIPRDTIMGGHVFFPSSLFPPTSKRKRTVSRSVSELLISRVPTCHEALSLSLSRRRTLTRVRRRLTPVFLPFLLFSASRANLRLRYRSDTRHGYGYVAAQRVPTRPIYRGNAHALGYLITQRG